MPEPKSATTRDVIGVDNGITETGMVWLRDGRYMAGATIQGSKAGRDLERVRGLGKAFLGVLTLWIVQGKCEAPVFVFELPTVRRGKIRNVDTYRMQVRVLQTLEDIAVSHGPVYEVMPTEPKLALTGDGRASKEDMVAASRWSDRFDIPGHTREALADAYGIALCGERFGPTSRFLARAGKVYTDEEGL